MMSFFAQLRNENCEVTHLGGRMFFYCTKLKYYVPTSFDKSYSLVGINFKSSK
jgi:hypothetical protein